MLTQFSFLHLQPFQRYSSPKESLRKKMKITKMITMIIMNNPDENAKSLKDRISVVLQAIKQTKSVITKCI